MVCGPRIHRRSVVRASRTKHHRDENDSCARSNFSSGQRPDSTHLIRRCRERTHCSRTRIGNCVVRAATDRGGRPAVVPSGRGRVRAPAPALNGHRPRQPNRAPELARLRFGTLPLPRRSTADAHGVCRAACTATGDLEATDRAGRDRGEENLRREVPAIAPGRAQRLPRPMAVQRGLSRPAGVPAGGGRLERPDAVPSRKSGLSRGCAA